MLGTWNIPSKCHRCVHTHTHTQGVIKREKRSQKETKIKRNRKLERKEGRKRGKREGGKGGWEEGYYPKRDWTTARHTERGETGAERDAESKRAGQGERAPHDAQRMMPSSLQASRLSQGLDRAPSPSALHGLT